jgi:WS/DGAT/MGAT family acyltransferase
MDKPLHNVDHMMWDINDPTSLNTITGMMTFKQKIEKQTLCQIIEERLLSFERFRHKVVEKDGQPVWHNDEDFDLHCHIHHTALPEPGDYQTLQAEISHLMSIPLDHSKPLWKVNLIDNFQGGSVIVYRLHHAIGDGISLIKVVFSLTGDSPEQSLAPLEKDEQPKEKIKSEGIVDQMRKALYTGEAIYNEAQQLLKDPDTLKQNLKDTFDSAMELGKLFFGKSVSGTSSIYKGEMSFRKIPSWTHKPLDLLTVKAISKSHGVTINDVLLSMMTGALRYHQINKGITPQDALRVVCPVNLRKPGDPIEVENKIGFISLELPIHLENPHDRMTYIREKTELLKKSWEPMLLYNLLHVLADMLPKRVEKLFTDYMGTMVGAVITNVPGPKKPIYLAGKEVNDMVFWVPQTSTLGIGVSLLSYNNKAYLGVVTDPNIVSDPDIIIEGFYKEFEGLKEELQKETERSA